MRYSADHKQLTKKKILDAAARRFRAEGYEGLGIDGLAKAAGVTNGAFYGHFGSKAEAFHEVAIQGLVELREGIERFRAEYGAHWLVAFTRFYFSEAKVGCAENACALPSFAPEMVRASKETRTAFEHELALVMDALAKGLPDAAASAKERAAWAILALLSGGVTLARSIDDPEQRKVMIAGFSSAVFSLVALLGGDAK
jgi:TetR/AcrR family transcriptional repressor of nem operon